MVDWAPILNRHFQNSQKSYSKVQVMDKCVMMTMFVNECCEHMKEMHNFMVDWVPISNMSFKKFTDGWLSTHFKHDILKIHKDVIQKFS